MKIVLAIKVLFEHNSLILSGKSLKLLEKFAESVHQSESESRVWIEGHADEDGSAEYNMQVSQGRSNAVKAQLESLKIENSNIKVVSYGNTRPVSLRKEGGSEKNRRVTVSLIEHA